LRRTHAAALAAALAAAPCAAQALPGWGRVALYAQTLRSTSDDGRASSFTELSAAVTLRSASVENGGVEYAVDMRGADAPSSGRPDRVSIYDAYVGGKLPGGVVGARVGQMWLNDLGALGALGGFLVEASPRGASKAGRLRLGLFAGAEPLGFEAGYVSGVRKAGAYAALDGARGRRHVVGWIVLRNSGLTERSVVTVTNFVPAGKCFFLYQAAEVDVTGPAGKGSGGLTYVFANARYAPVPRLELQANVHHGRSIDTRTITQDVLNGRPIDARALDGFLYESVGGRVTVEVVKNVRVYGGYAVDRSNRDDVRSGRATFGVWAANLAGSGLDVTLSDNRIDRTGGGYDSWYASIGRSLGPRLYLTLDASTSRSVFRFTDSGGTLVETRPHSRRYGLSGVLNLGRRFSFLLTLEELRDDTSHEERGLFGIIVRL